jgi:hypothetical protein
MSDMIRSELARAHLDDMRRETEHYRLVDSVARPMYVPGFSHVLAGLGRWMIETGSDLIELAGEDERPEGQPRIPDHG